VRVLQSYAFGVTKLELHFSCYKRAAIVIRSNGFGVTG
jgi:hypothetical protein